MRLTLAALVLSIAAPSIVFARPSGPVTLATGRKGPDHPSINRGDAPAPLTSDEEAQMKAQAAKNGSAGGATVFATPSSDDSAVPVDSAAVAAREKAEADLALVQKKLADANALLKKEADAKTAEANAKKAAALTADEKLKEKRAKDLALKVQHDLAVANRKIAEQDELAAARKLAEAEGKPLPVAAASADSVAVPAVTKNAAHVPAVSPSGTNKVAAKSASSSVLASTSTPSKPVSASPALARNATVARKALSPAGSAGTRTVSASTVSSGVASPGVTRSGKPAPKYAARMAAAAAEKSGVRADAKLAKLATTASAPKNALTPSSIQAQIDLTNSLLDQTCSDETTATANLKTLTRLNDSIGKTSAQVNAILQNTRQSAADPATAIKANAIRSTVGVSAAMVAAKSDQRFKVSKNVSRAQLDSVDARRNLLAARLEIEDAKKHPEKKRRHEPPTASQLATLTTTAYRAATKHKQMSAQLAAMDADIAAWSGKHDDLAKMRAKEPSAAQKLAFAAQKEKEARVLDKLSTALKQTAGHANSCHRLAMQSSMRRECVAASHPDTTDACGSSVFSRQEQADLIANGVTPGTTSTGLASVAAPTTNSGSVASTQSSASSGLAQN